MYVHGRVRAALFALLAGVAGTAVAATAGAAPSSALVIRPGQGIGKLRLGMSEAAVRRAMGKPRFVVERSSGFGVRTIEYQYGLAEYTVTLAGRAGRRRAVRVGTTLLRERTPAGVGVGSLERVVRRRYPSLRCRPLQTVRSGSIRYVSQPQRECTLFAPSGRRTIFTSDVHERLFEVITPQIWARRAVVIEIAVAAPA